ncbi:MAG: protein kinase domain-containing protein [Planctomycetota bacterium]|jgi:tetratricopeptide (TPR) repeat protein
MGLVPQFNPGDRIDELEIRRRIGAGAFGTVYEARDTLIERKVALKVVPVGGAPEQEARALRELRAVGRLSHPNIVTLYRVRRLTDPAVWMLEFEFMAGGTLQERMESAEPIGIEAVCRIGADLAAALEAAHGAGIVHGDIKPGNVLLDARGVLKVGDFGLARLTSDISMALSNDGIEGTPQYLAPELVMGSRATAAADIWALGIVLYRMLSGHHPFATRNFNALFHSIQNSRPAPLPASVPATLSALVFRCLEKQPRDRPQAAADVRAVLEGSQVSSGAPPAAPRAHILVERESELATLRSMLESVRGGHGRTLLVSGSEGMGRGALAEFASDLAGNAGFLRLEAATTPVEGVLSPLVAAVRSLIDTTEIPDASFDSANTAVRRMLDSQIGPRVDDGGATTWAVEHLLRAWSRERPVQVSLFDLHEADDEDMRIVRQLVRGLAHARVWFVGTYATEGAPRSGEEGGSSHGVEELGALREVDRIELAPLSPEGILEVLKDHTGARHIDAAVLQRVYDTCEGNPGHAIELLRHLEETGALRHADKRILASGSLDAGALPRRLHDLATIRMDGLDGTEREILDIAAVDGRNFDGRAIASVLGVPLLTVLRSLQRIYRDRGLVVPHGSGFRFASAVSRRALYQELAPELKREIHRALATHLEERGSPAPERVGTHWECAGELDRARDYLCDAALQAYRRQEFNRAIRLASRAGLDPESVDDSTFAEYADSLFALMHSLENTGQGPQASRLGEHLTRLADQSGDATLAMRATVHDLAARIKLRGPDDSSRAELERATRDLPQCEELGRAWYLLGFIKKFAGDTEEADRDFERAESIYRELRLRGELPKTLHQRGSVALRRGKLARAESLYEQAATAYRQVSRRVGAATSGINAAFAALDRGNIAGLDQRLERSIRTLDVEGAETHAAHARVFLGTVHYALGFTERALHEIAEARHQLEASGYLPGLSYACVEHAHLLGITGENSASRDALEAARRAAEAASDRPTLAYAAVLASHLSLDEGDRGEALRRVDECVRISRDDKTYLEVMFRSLMLAELAIYGMDSDAVAVSRELAAVPNVPPTITRQVSDAIDGLLAYRDPSTNPYRLLTAAQALESDHLGRRREYLRGLAALMRAEGAARQGDVDGALASHAIAERTAEALRHGPFRLACDEWLGRNARG